MRRTRRWWTALMLVPICGMLTAFTALVVLVEADDARTVARPPVAQVLAARGRSGPREDDSSRRIELGPRSAREGPPLEVRTTHLGPDELGIVLADGRRTWTVRAAAAEALGRDRSPRGLDLLLQAATSTSATTRRLAALGLGPRAEEPRAALALEALVHDGDPLVGAGAARALADSPTSAPRLVAALTGARAIAVQVACIEALARVGRAEDVAALVPWTRRADAAGEAAVWTILLICGRTGAEVPPDLPAARPAARPELAEHDRAVHAVGVWEPSAGPGAAVGPDLGPTGMEDGPPMASGPVDQGPPR